MLYYDHSNCVNFDWLRLCQIDPPRQPSQPGMVFLARTASLRFGLVSQSQNSHNWSGRSIVVFCLIFASFFQFLSAEEIDLHLYETSFYSPNGEDGIFARLFASLQPMGMRFCVECGANDGMTNSLTYLLRNQGWRALLLDRSYDIPSISLHKEFVTADNVNAIFEKYYVPKVFDLLTIDTGSNDFYIWKTLDERYRPSVVCIAYNGFHKPDEDKVVQYHPFYCGDDTIYFGASMLAMYHLGKSKKYALVYAEEAGRHLFFVREDLLQENQLIFKDVDNVKELYRPPAYERMPGKQRNDPKNRPYFSSKELLKK